MRAAWGVQAQMRHFSPGGIRRGVEDRIAHTEKPCPIALVISVYELRYQRQHALD